MFSFYVSPHFLELRMDNILIQQPGIWCLENGKQADPPNILCEGPYSLPVALDANIVDDGVEAGAQDEEEDNEDVSLLAGAGHHTQEDEGV